MDEADLGQEPEERRWWTAVGEAGRLAAPYWFVASGVVLGVGGVIADKPLAGACGAVAGITAGLLERQRASVYRQQALAMRNRLRKHRAKAEATEADLREQISKLQTEVWEHRMFSMITANMASAKAVTASAEGAGAAAAGEEPVDGELLETGSLDVVEPEIELGTPAEIEGEVEEPAAIEATAAAEEAGEAEEVEDQEDAEPGGARVIQLHEAREAGSPAEKAEKVEAATESTTSEPDAPAAQAG